MYKLVDKICGHSREYVVREELLKAQKEMDAAQMNLEEAGKELDEAWEEVTAVSEAKDVLYQEKGRLVGTV